MLKIGTAKAGSVVECPQCRGRVLVPPETVPKAEELYQLFKQSRKDKRTIQKTSGSILAETVENAEEAEFTQWLEEVWSDINVAGTKGLKRSSPHPKPVFDLPETNMAAINETAVKLKQQQRMFLLFKVSAGILFVAGILFGAFLYSQMIQRPNVPQNRQQAVPDQNEAQITLSFRDKNGEIQPDADAVIIFLPKNKQITQRLSFNGLLPDQKQNNETIRQIEEMDGVYERTDTNGNCTFRYRAGISYFLIAVSAHRNQTADPLPPQTAAGLRDLFSDCETLGDYAVWAEELIWQDGTHYHKHTF
ncbi:MAG: hypothetical protein LBH00_10195 [Planctomycetaceae bacterium]|jgi:hypothetical protein|nr:hypothetical protein [Planctomycetaceae bacterium]